MICPTKALLSILLLAPMSIFGMEEEVLTNTVEIAKGIVDIEWAPSGTELLVADGSEWIQVYTIENDQFKFLKKIEATGSVVKIVSSPSQNLIAVGLKNGLIEIFDGSDYEDFCSLINLPGLTIQKLCWLGKYIVAYTKDYEQLERGKSRHYPNKTVLNLCDPATGGVLKKFTIAQHVVDCKGAPSGEYISLIKDLLNQKEGTFSLETMDREVKYCCDIYETKENTHVAQLVFDSKVVTHAWSPNSDKVAILLSSGDLQIYQIDGKLYKKWSSKDIQHTKCTIDWSPVTNYLYVPTKKSSVAVYDVDEGDGRITTIPLSKFTGEEFNKYLLSFCVKSSPTSPLLAISAGDLLESLYDTKLFLDAIEKKTKKKRLKIDPFQGI